MFNATATATASMNAICAAAESDRRARAARLAAEAADAEFIAALARGVEAGDFVIFDPATA